MLQLSGITLRPAQDDDLDQVVNLDRLSFAPLKSSAAIAQGWFGGTLSLPDRRLFLAVEDSTRSGVGTYGQLDLALWLQGCEFPAMGITGVAVAPHRRGERIAQLMLEHALVEGLARNLPLVMLYPFQHGFYRKLGWAWVGQAHQYRVSTRHLAGFSERSRIFPYQPQQRQAVQTLYEEAAKQHNGWVQRRSWQWDARFKPQEGKEIYCYIEEGGAVLGYVIFQFVLLDPPHPRLTIVVQEWVAPTVAAYRGILGFLASLRDQVTTVVWNTYPEDPFPYLLKEQRRDPVLPPVPFDFGFNHRFGEIGGGFMWRLLDISRALELRSIQPHISFALTFQVTDPIFGTQTIAVECGDGQMRCSNQRSSTILHISVEHLTELFCGLRRSHDLLWTKEIEMEGDRSLLTQLDAAWQATLPFCWDFF